MASKKVIVRRLNELESAMKSLKKDIEEHYKISGTSRVESKIFKNEYASLSIEFLGNCWAILSCDNSEITLGKYPNARWQIIEDALKYAKGETKRFMKFREAIDKLAGEKLI